MSDLVPRRSNGREDRRVGRELARLDAQARLLAAGVEHTADVQTARVLGLAHVAGQALHATAFLTEKEQHLSRLVPEASERLTVVADVAAMGLAQIVNNTATQLGR